MTQHRNVPDATPDGSDPAVEAAITRVLGREPALTIPEGFAAGVARRALNQAPSPHSRWLGWGPGLAVASAAVLTAGMFALAPHAAPSLRDLRFDVELLLLAELSGLLLFSHRLLSRE